MPARGYPDSLKREAVAYSYLHGAPKAAHTYGVGEGTIYIWRKAFR